MSVPAPERILVIKLRYVGDVLLATPVLSRLRESFPKVHLAMLVNPGTDDMVRDHPALDEVLVLERGNLARQWRFVRELRRQRFDLVIDLTDGDRSAFLRTIGNSIRPRSRVAEPERRERVRRRFRAAHNGPYVHAGSSSPGKRPRSAWVMSGISGDTEQSIPTAGA
jgi:ADP-heptose:LPS heptosyltransferase